MPHPEPAPEGASDAADGTPAKGHSHRLHLGAADSVPSAQGQRDAAEAPAADEPGTAPAADTGGESPARRRDGKVRPLRTGAGAAQASEKFTPVGPADADAPLPRAKVVPGPGQRNAAVARQAAGNLKPMGKPGGRRRPGVLIARPQFRLNPTVNPSQWRPRHSLLFASFVLLVGLPALVSSIYLWIFAEDQYASTVAFTVRKEEGTSAVEMLGGITELAGSSTPDTDILYEYLYSQKLVAEIDADINLREIWSKAPSDPVFSYRDTGSIEDLVDHWERKVSVSYDTGSKLIEVRALAFDPDDAQRITTALYDKSSEMINELNQAAREDAIKSSREELETSVARLKTARQALTAFRNRTQIVDPTADISAQTGLLAKLEEELASTLIDLDLLRQSTNARDVRVDQAEKRVAVIETRIAAEREKLGLGDSDATGEAFAGVLAEYESLAVDREFAETAYGAALAAYDAAQAEARRKSRYLAAHVTPTRAESARYPQRWLLVAAITTFAFLAWSIMAMVYYSVRDRR